MKPFVKFRNYNKNFIKTRRYFFFRLPKPLCKLCFRLFLPPERWAEVISPKEIAATEKKNFDVHLVSFPKSGRTWLRLMIGKAIQEHFKLKCTDKEMTDLHPLAKYDKIPKIRVDHDDNPHYKSPKDVSLNKEAYCYSKVIFLSRDPRDVLVSNYFEMTKRQRLYCDDISNFLREDVGSIGALIKYYNVWASERNTPKDFLLVRYEDIHKNPKLELKKCLQFVGLDIDPQAIERAVKFATFDNMHNMEREGNFDAGSLKVNDKEDQESYKTRKGVIKGFNDYLSSEDIKFLDEKIESELSKFFGY